MRPDVAIDVIRNHVSHLIRYNCPDPYAESAEPIAGEVFKTIIWDNFLASVEDAVIAVNTYVKNRTLLLREELTNYQLRAKLLSQKCTELGFGPLTVGQIHELVIESMPQPSASVAVDDPPPTPPVQSPVVQAAPAASEHPSALPFKTPFELNVCAILQQYPKAQALDVCVQLDAHYKVEHDYPVTDEERSWASAYRQSKKQRRSIIVRVSAVRTKMVKAGLLPPSQVSQ
jgi:hypothetical protein